MTAGPAVSLPRILIVAPMKSGSSYVARVVRNYFGLETTGFPLEIDWRAEHILTPWMTSFLRGQGFCFNFHMLPHESNMRALAEEGIAPIGLWRNLGDMIVSWDDHITSGRHGGWNWFVYDIGRFVMLPPNERYTFIIDSLMPWYLMFYLRWHVRGLVLHPYEQMLLGYHAYFTGLIGSLLTHPPIDAEIDRVLGGGARDADLLNVGRSGRSAGKLDDAAKRRLEEKILTHPDRDQLEILLWELPWEVPALAEGRPLDGQVVQSAGDGQPYFVSRGRAFPISRPQWLLGRVGERRSPRIVDAADLESYPRGPALL